MWSNYLLTIFVLIFSPEIGVERSIEPLEQRVLIVPFDRLGFQSTIELTEIITANNLSSINEIGPLFQQAVVSSLSQKGGNYRFFSLPENEIKMLKRQAPIIHKMDPVNHFGIDLSRLHQEGIIEQLLSNFSADYILFLCRYSVKNKLFSSSRSFDGSTFVKWSIHEMDYEVYDAEKKLIALGYDFPMSPKRPTDTTYLTYGLKVDGMTSGYQDLRIDIEAKIASFDGEAVYKSDK